MVKSKFSRYKGTFHVKRKVSDQISPWISAGVYAAVQPVISRVEKVQRGRWSGEKEWPGKTMRERKKKREKDSSILKTCIDISWKTFYPACKRCSLSRIHFFRGLLVKQWKIYRSLRRRLRTKNSIEKLDRCIFKGSIIPSIWILINDSDRTIEINFWIYKVKHLCEGRERYRACVHKPRVLVDRIRCSNILGARVSLYPGEIYFDRDDR